MADEMEEDLPLLLEEEWQTGAEFDDDEVHGQYVAFTVDGTLSMRGDNTFDQFRPTVDRTTGPRVKYEGRSYKRCRTSWTHETRKRYR